MSNASGFPLERKSAMQVFPFPEAGRVVEEDPPCLCWLPLEGEHTYTVTVSTPAGETLWSADTNFNYAVPNRFFGAGSYTWNVRADGMERGEVPFSIAPNAPQIPRIDAETLYDQIPNEHPRHLFLSADIKALLRDKAEEIEILKRNVEEAYANGIPEMPMYHRDPNALPYREFFGRFRYFCDRNLVACALAYALLGDEKAGRFAKELLLTMCDRNPAGPCSLLGPWGDEIGLSMARCLPAVYDLLYSLLNERERTYVAYTVRAYAEQCYIRLKKRNYCENPGDSHVGRLPAYLGEAAMVLKDSGIQPREEALRWLDYALEIYGGIFPYFGTPDGAWAEGVFYSTSYTKWFLPFFSAVERFGGTRFLDRPFYRKLTTFFLHFADPAYELHPFGDGYWCAPEDEEWPGFFAQSPCRFYADRFGPALARERARAVKPQLYLLHLLDIFLPIQEKPNVPIAPDPTNMAVFPDAGFVAMHTDLAHTENNLTVLARASKFGSDSHRHADQGSFAIFFGGVALITPSGYFGRGWGTRHHMEWLKQTRAHNAILIDGEGQPHNSMESRGKILSHREQDGVREVTLDLSAAYTASLTRWVRTIRLEEGCVTVLDEIDAPKAVTVSYPLHFHSLPTADGNNLELTRKGVHLTVCPLGTDLTLKEITDRFAVDLNEGVPEEFHATMPQQYHATYQTESKKTHRLTVRYTVC